MANKKKNQEVTIETVEDAAVAEANSPTNQRDLLMQALEFERAFGLTSDVVLSRPVFEFLVFEAQRNNGQ